MISYSPDENSKVVSKLFRGFSGFVQADRMSSLAKSGCDGIIRCGVDAQGAYADCELGAHILLAEAEARTKSTKDAENYKIPGAGSGSKDPAVFASSSGGADLESAVGDLELPITFRISRAA